MAEHERERRRHWTGSERNRLRQYQQAWEVRSRAPEDERQEPSYRPKSRLDVTDRPEEK